MKAALIVCEFEIHAPTPPPLETALPICYFVLEVFTVSCGASYILEGAREGRQKSVCGTPSAI